jgi:purine nucleosidase
MQKLIIDTDPGQDIDDLLAIVFALRRPELDIRAITTVTYPSDQRARLIKRLLRYVDRTDIPVGAGMQYPFRPMSEWDLKQQHDLAVSMNHKCFAEPEDPKDDPGNVDAVDLIIRMVEENPGEIALACIAPLTNIACALRKKPSIAGKIKYIAMMGGEMKNNQREHNVAFDYIASDIVFRSGIPLYVGTWSVTRLFALSMVDCDRFRRHESPLYRALGHSIDAWHPAQSWKPGPVMYDIFPIVWAFDRSYYTTEHRSIRVETKGEFTSGMTVFSGDVPNAHVTTEIKAAELRGLYFKTLFG